MASVWFGLHLGPRTTPATRRTATRESAIVGAQVLVSKAIAKRGGASLPGECRHVGGGGEKLLFPEGQVSAEPADGDAALWTVSGTATMGNASLKWLVVEHWNGVSTWQAKVMEVVRLKRKAEKHE